MLPQELPTRAAPSFVSPRIRRAFSRLRAPSARGARARTVWWSVACWAYCLSSCVSHPTKSQTAQHLEPARERVELVVASAAPRAEPPAAPKVPIANGLPSALSPLDTLPVRHFAFASDGALSFTMHAHTAGAVEDAEGVTVCLLSGPLSIPDGSIVPHPRPFSLEATAHCFRERGATIAKAPQALVGEVSGNTSFVLTLETPSGSRRRTYAFERDVEFAEGDANGQRARSQHEGVGKPPPWPRSLSEELKRARKSRRVARRISLLAAATREEVTAVAPPAWVALLRRSSELETRTLISGEQAVLAVTLSRASLADGEPAREFLVARDDERWTSSPLLSEVISQAVRAPSLGTGAMLVLTRAQNVGSNLSPRVLYADEARLHVLAPVSGELVQRGHLRLGEVGYARLVDKHRVWRVFYQARVVGPGCLQVRRDHSWSALYDPQSTKLTERSRIRAGLTGIPTDLPSRYAKTEARYAWNGEDLVRGGCK